VSLALAAEFRCLRCSACVNVGLLMVDSVNMYASCWILTKVDNLPPPTPDSEMALTPRGEPPVADPTRGMAELEI
jgi:hypothetical protein